MAQVINMKAMPTSLPPTPYDLEQFVFEIFIKFKNNVINGKLTKVVGIRLKSDSYILVNPHFCTLFSFLLFSPKIWFQLKFQFLTKMGIGIKSIV